MSVNANITKKERDCLVSIWQGSRDGFPVRVTSLAESMKIKPPTVEELLDRLEDKKLIVRNRGMVMLSDEGKAAYRRIMLAHRALETFMVQCGDDADRACRMISNFDYLIDEDSALLILSKIGNPANCPHGKPIIER